MDSLPATKRERQVSKVIQVPSRHHKKSSPSVVAILLPLCEDVITFLLSFLGLPDRLSCRLTSKEFRALCPSPWRLLGDDIERFNNFNDDDCNSKLSNRLTPVELPFPDDGYNSSRLRNADCKGRNCRAGEFREHDYDDGLLCTPPDNYTSFRDSDPRRGIEYADLARRVEDRPYDLSDAAEKGGRTWITNGPYAPTNERSPEAERLRLLLDFSRACVIRLQKHHEELIQGLICGNFYWVTARRSLSMESREDDYSDHYLTRVEFCESKGCAHQIACELSSLNFAARELYSDGSPHSVRFPYFYGFDETDEDGRTRVMLMCGEGVELEAQGVYYAELFGTPKNGSFQLDYNDSKALLFGVEMGSDEHFSRLLNHENASVFEPAFGRDFTDAVFNVLTFAKNSWPETCRRMRRFDELRGYYSSGDEEEEPFWDEEEEGWGDDEQFFADDTSIEDGGGGEGRGGR